ncbi:hypothetical protein [Streptomyces mirabilis]|uniref:hypothetical protein n=1 Tax=Streptomyces mirabilis TaxID=68239 RepID=UPI0036ABE156
MDAYLCSQALPFESAQSATASELHTELTRMLYAYCAVENLTRAISPGMPDDGKVVKAASTILANAKIDGPMHYRCAVHHAHTHCEENAILRNNKKMRRAFNVPHGRTIVPLQVGVQLRHFLTHGVFRLPTPIRSGDSWDVGGKDTICLVRNGTTCLLMAVQMLLAYALDAGLLEHPEPEIELQDDLWVPAAEGGSWVETLSPRSYVMAANLRLSDGPPRTSSPEPTTEASNEPSPAVVADSSATQATESEEFMARRRRLH